MLAEDLSVTQIFDRVAETYKTLRVCQFSAERKFESSRPLSANIDTSTSFDVSYELAMVQPDKMRVKVKSSSLMPRELRALFHFDLDEDVTIISNGNRTSRYSANTNQYTDAQSAIVDDDAEKEPDSHSSIDLAVAARDTLINQYIRMRKYAAVAHIAKRSKQLNIDRTRIDCYIVRFRMLQSMNEVWIDKQRFLVLRHVQTVPSDGYSNAMRMTMDIKHADISSTPDDGLFKIAIK